jgi:hypothetical protein
MRGHLSKVKVKMFKRIKKKYLEQLRKANAGKECPHFVNVTGIVLDITLWAEPWYS